MVSERTVRRDGHRPSAAAAAIDPHGVGGAAAASAMACRKAFTARLIRAGSAFADGQRVEHDIRPALHWRARQS